MTARMLLSPEIKEKIIKKRKERCESCVQDFKKSKNKNCDR